MITIGTIFKILVPLPIKNLKSGDIPLVETHYPVIVMKHPSQNIPTVKIDHFIEGNTAKAFVEDAFMICVQSTAPEETNCAGLFCDKQHLNVIIPEGCGCGCYHMLGRWSNLALEH
eukprot:6993901-Ditylum_brightwellii.AAC.1